MDKKHTSLIDDITALLDYLWHNERKHYYEAECPHGHIFINLKHLRDDFGLSEFYRD